MPITRLILIALIVMGVSALPRAQTEQTYSLVWADEFEGTVLNADNWTPDIGDGCPDLCGWGNNELQYYRAENVAVSGGNLVLTSIEQPFGGRSFTSGKVTTRDNHSFLYGRVEMRAKIPTGGGMWPAFWMMPQDDIYGSWAASGEIDIMESANNTTWVAGALHFGGSWPDNASTNTTFGPAGVNFSDEFHLYAVEWEPDSIRWYVDDTLFATRTSSQWYSTGAPSNHQAPFDQEFYLLLNTAVGGDYTGCTSPACITASLPQQYLIDYVRVYKETVPTASEMPDLPSESTLEGSFPNPFSERTAIRFGLSEQTEVRIVIYDMLGRAVNVLLDTTLPAGRHEITFDGNGLPSGTYACRLETTKGSLVRTMLLTR